MKTKLILLASLFLIYTGVLYGQPNRNKVEDRVEKVIARFDNVLKLDKNTSSAVALIFTDFFTAQDRLRENIQGPASSLAQGFARQDFQSVRKQNEKIIEERDDKLKKLLTSDQYKKWIDEIEPSLKIKK